MATSQSDSQNMSQLNGTALPSLALESLQELDNLKLDAFDRNKAEDTIAGALGSLYSGKHLTLSHKYD
jgi:hypothetical protein